MRYYYCINCGYVGDFKFQRKRSIICDCCGYNDLVQLNKEEWLKEPQNKKELINEKSRSQN